MKVEYAYAHMDNQQEIYYSCQRLTNTGHCTSRQMLATFRQLKKWPENEAIGYI